MFTAKHLNFCKSDGQRDVVNFFIKNPNASKADAGRHLNRASNSICRSIKRINTHASQSGFAPEANINHPIAPGFKLKGYSTFAKDEDGNPTWYKTIEDKEAQEELQNGVLEAFKESLPRIKPVAAPKHTLDELLTCYVITDYHLGMMAWHEETGADWDLKIAEDLLINWFSTAIENTPKSETAIFAQLGDFLHFDGLLALTPEHKNVLDADTRFQKIVRVAIKVVRQIIKMLLKKHNSVHIVMAEGNHDPASSVWMREWLHAHYEDEPRVFIDLSPDPYYCHEFGKTSLFFHHGHKRKPNQIDDVVVAKFREVYGRTLHSYGHSGHLHSDQTVETNLLKWEQHRTLAAPDAYASRGGWISGRDAKAITYHKEYGEISRVTINPAMVKA